MKLFATITLKSLAPLFILFFTTAVWADTGADAVSAVKGFNESITAGDKTAAVEHLATGGVQFTLSAVHDGVDPSKLTTPLVDYWSMILPVILASSESYTRNIEVLNAESFGDIATVWVRTTTVSLRKGQTDAKTSEFTETYLLVAGADGWKIASIADNRQATKLSSD